MSEKEITTIKRFARFYDIYCNSERFSESMKLVIEEEQSVFIAFNSFFEFAFEKTKRTHAVDLSERAEILYDYLVNIKKIEKNKAKEKVAGDFYSVEGRTDKLKFI